MKYFLLVFMVMCDGCEQVDVAQINDGDVMDMSNVDMSIAPDLLSLQACSWNAEPEYNCVVAGSYLSYGGLSCVYCPLIASPCVARIVAHYVLCVGNCSMCKER
jgi:hypothetical protein